MGFLFAKNADYTFGDLTNPRGNPADHIEPSSDSVQDQAIISSL